MVGVSPWLEAAAHLQVDHEASHHTHILEEVEAVCTRAIIIAKGKLLADATPNELLKRSNHYNSVSVSVSNTEKAKKVLEALEPVRSVDIIDKDWLLAYPNGKNPTNVRTITRVTAGKNRSSRSRKAIGFIYYAASAKVDEAAHAAYQQKLDKDLRGENKIWQIWKE